MRQSAAAITLVVVTLGAGPTLGAELLETVFQVTFAYVGSDEVLNDTVVPLLPDNACYNWYVRIEGPPPKAATETLRLPVALGDWGTLATDPNDGIDISADGMVATRSFMPELDADGWFSHTWCVAAGDPLGAHSIEIALDDTALTRFDFTVVLPEDYYWPAIAQPQPHERSVDHSW